MRLLSTHIGAVVFVGFLVMAGCTNPAGADSSDDPTLLSGEWIWTSGSSRRLARGVYGTKGTPNTSNVPGGRWNAVSWSDANGNLWLFGGFGRDSDGWGGYLNDLWQFDGNAWTWVSGSNEREESGHYGSLGVADADNVPGARDGAVSSIDEGGNLWLFGGQGYDSDGTTLGRFNDLWRFDGKKWTWISGSDELDQSGIYGSVGVAGVHTVPGARNNAVSWIDSGGKLWLFGGAGYDSDGNSGRLNDLWRFDGNAWTWVSGSDEKNGHGHYGSRGVAHEDNVPGARNSAVSWIDSGGKLWLFGGAGYDSDGNSGRLNDLWRFDGNAWTWVSGSDESDGHGHYGSRGIAHEDNLPGARSGAVSWIDAHESLWLFGGFGYDSDGNSGRLNDLWRFDGNAWTWVSGSDERNGHGHYGSRGIAHEDNLPGARSSAVSGSDVHGNLWLFGGHGRDSSGSEDRLNDLWLFRL